MKVYAINDRFFVSAIKHFEKVGRLEKEIDRLQTIIDNLEDEADHYYKKSELLMSFIKI